MRRLSLLSLGFVLCLSSTALAAPHAFLPKRAAVLVGQSTHRPQPIARPIQITLQRTACFGFCPMYRLVIDGNGTVTYTGERFVKVTGTRTATISRAAVQQLVKAFEAADYFAMPDHYRGEHTDAPSTITSITMGKRTKTVNHYMGSPNVPQALIDLEAQVDAIANSQQWVGTDEERMPNRPIKE